MKKRLPPLNWLRAFEASARRLNFTQAADELSLTQAAISQQVKGLESQLGTALFKRLPRGLELTDAGQAYLPVVHEAIERLAVATDEIFGQGRSRCLTVLVNLVFFTHWLAPKLADFRQQHPEVNLQFTSNIWLDDHNSKEAHMEIRYGHGHWSGYHTDRLSHDHLIPVCSPDVAAQLTSNSPNELQQQTLLHVIGYNEGWGHWFNSTGFTHMDASRGIQFDTLIAGLEAAKCGAGFALGRSSLIDELLRQEKLVAPFPQTVATDEAFYLAQPDNKITHPYAETFRQWLLEQTLA